MNGVLNILKPPKMTSHDVVSAVRRALDIKKVGHTGTLDPMAAGVLPICVGRSTKIVEFLQNDKKKYRAKLKLGITTDTEDSFGEVLSKKDVKLEKHEIEKAVLSFVGEINQIPPMYSALKVNGKKLYELAREGIVIERNSRLRTIYSIDIISITKDTCLFDVVCSKGTYIRTLCADIGNMLNVGGHMSFLLRLASGNFLIENTITLEELKEKSKEDIISTMIAVDKALKINKKINISDKACELIKNGVKIDLIRYVDFKFREGDYVLVYANSTFTALSKFSNGKLIVSKLFDISR